MSWNLEQALGKDNLHNILTVILTITPADAVMALLSSKMFVIFGLMFSN